VEEYSTVVLQYRKEMIEGPLWTCFGVPAGESSILFLFCSGLRDVSGCGTIGEYETAPVYISNNKQHA